MKKRSLSAICIAFISMALFSQEAQLTPKNSFSVMFYNVENLFDVTDDPGKNDDDFTPGGRLAWNEERLAKKVSDLSGVIESSGGRELPAIIGLCEVETNETVRMLANSPRLRKGKYEVIHFESSDERGIDAALLVSLEEFTVVESKAIPVILTQTPEDFTRDILYSRLRGDDGNDYHIFVNHWPSRNQNTEESETKRISAALTLRKETDLILNKDNNARIIIMGDFNDEPTNRSVFQILNANGKRKNASYRELYNLMFDMHNTSDEGTITYMGNWQMFDQMIVSQSLLKKNSGYFTDFGGGSVVKEDKLLLTDPATGKKDIFRTYYGSEYRGGISDHLPVTAKFRKEK